MTSRVEEFRYLVIGGAPKAGTTSLFAWLSAHPGVCVSSLKETRFFLDGSSSLPSANRFTGGNLQDYERFFRGCPRGFTGVRVDATPDYLYSETALRIAELLPLSKIVFVLRDPVERMVSWYKYSLQRGFIAPRTSFEHYLDIQAEPGVGHDGPVHLQALEQCCYENYLPGFRKAFGSRCLEIEFEHLRASPGSVVSQVCAFVGLDDRMYADFEFGVENESVIVPNYRVMDLYTRIRRTIAQSLHSRPRIAGLLRAPNRVIKKMLLRDTAPAAEVRVRDEVAQRIRYEIERRTALERTASPLGADRCDR